MTFKRIYQPPRIKLNSLVLSPRDAWRLKCSKARFERRPDALLPINWRPVAIGVLEQFRFIESPACNDAATGAASSASRLVLSLLRRLPQ